jgi:hypothetical protein
MALPTPSVDDGPRFHSNMPISEVTECDTRAIEASVISSAPPVVETKDGVTHETRPTPIDPTGLGGSNLPILDRDTEVRMLAHGGPEAALQRTKSQGEMHMSPSGLCLSFLDADKVISTFSFDPNL